MTNATLTVKMRTFQIIAWNCEARRVGRFRKAQRFGPSRWFTTADSACFAPVSSCFARPTWRPRWPTCSPASPLPASATGTRSRGCSWRPPRSTPAASSSTTSSTARSIGSSARSGPIPSGRIRTAHAAALGGGLLALGVGAAAAANATALRRGARDRRVRAALRRMGQAACRHRPAEHGDVPRAEPAARRRRRSGRAGEAPGPSPPCRCSTSTQ